MSEENQEERELEAKIEARIFVNYLKGLPDGDYRIIKKNGVVRLDFPTLYQRIKRWLGEMKEVKKNKYFGGRDE